MRGKEVKKKNARTKKIDKCLDRFGDLIVNLNKNCKLSNVHIPYRNSPLTKILRLERFV